MTYAERDGIWHLAARTDDAEALTVCGLRIVQQTYLRKAQDRRHGGHFVLRSV